MKIKFTTQIWREGALYVSYTPELDISSCGKTISEAKKNLLEAVEGFLEVAEEKGSLQDILAEAGFVKQGDELKKEVPEILVMEKVQLATP